ncbi:MAG: HAD family hydrolase [Geopsychrobacter sp.]|nr:HAD family hydrolase [Geopsychrobacter sp.]
MTDLEAVIYDCDGVLFESHQANLAYYNQIFAAFGCPSISDPDSAAAHICHTASSPVVLTKLMPAADVSAALQFAQGIDYRQFIPLMTEAPGLKASLGKLVRKYPLAIATNRGNSMPEILEHFKLAHYFKVVVTSRDVAQPKPAPDMLLLVAQRLAVDPERCLFIGDSTLDAGAAQAGEIPFIAFGAALQGGRMVRSHGELTDMLLVC